MAANHGYKRLDKVGTTSATSKLGHFPHPLLKVYRVSLGQALQDPTRLTDTRLAKNWFTCTLLYKC